MGRVVHDLACACGWRSPGGVMHPSGELPPCPECGGPTRVSWHTGRAPGLGGLTEMPFFGERLTSRQIEARVREMEAETGQQFHIEPDDPKRKQARIEERKHRLEAARRRRGIDTVAFQRQSLDDLRRMRAEDERAVREGRAPKHSEEWYARKEKARKAALDRAIAGVAVPSKQIVSGPGIVSNTAGKE